MGRAEADAAGDTPIYIQHITLNTGHLRASPRSEVADEALAAVAPLAAAASGTVLPIPGPGGYTLRIDRNDGAYLAVVEDDEANPLITIAVARRNRNGVGLWHSLHVWPGELATNAATPPDAPWLAARIEPDGFADPELLIWVGDFERCLAWAWLEGRGAPN
ncbi:MAG: hypothetical protein MI755_16405 [Sphingomonadales bacterium]|nr:hypothetical protein [Sphingomonadales bacterium]